MVAQTVERPPRKRRVGGSTPPHGSIRYGPKGWPPETRTLGWAAMEWACRNLTQPDRMEAGKPWRFTEEQARFLAWWYAIDRRGEWLYTYSVLRRMKGWGKDPLAAVMAAIEFVGPCRFGGWDGDVPVVVPQPAAWVQVAATAQPQTRNTLLFFPSLFSKSCIQEHRIDLGKEIIYAENGKRQIQAVTSSPRVIEGARATFVIAGETQHWLENNEGHEMAAAIRRNAAKVGGRAMAITNAHRIGERSVAELDWDAYQAQGHDKGPILYDSLEAPEDADLEDDDSLRNGLLAAAGDSYWLPIDRLMVDARDQRDTEVYRRRFYLNQIRQESGTWITKQEWADAEKPVAVPEGAEIALGFDGSRFRDSTALVGTVIETGYQWVLRAWDRPEGVEEWEVDEGQVNAAVHLAFERYMVHRMYCDPYWWEETIGRWAGEFGDKTVLFFHTNRQLAKLTRVIKAYETAVRTGELTHDRDPEFAAHIANAVKRDVNMVDETGDRLYTLGKEAKNSHRKIDRAMAALLSWQARVDCLADGVGASSVYESRGILTL